jgi:polyphosphate kinase
VLLKSGKQVAVLIELKARFDEERNISWAQKLEKAGVHVSYGLPGLKIHSKLTIVVREEEGELKRYVHIGTGNYHPDTAQVYEDLGYFTCDKEIGADVSDLFNLFTGYARMQEYRKLIVAPKFMREQIVSRIDREIEEAKAGRPAKIIAKMNNLEDPLIIQKLYEASNAGVIMKFFVRSVCRLIPGVKGMSENIEVFAIVGRFLEHSRCYYFNDSGNDEFLIGSADWMHRNLDARIEVLVPVEDPGLKEYLHFLFHVYLRDNRQRWKLMPDGNYYRVNRDKKEKKIGTHRALMNHTKYLVDPIPVSISQKTN